MAYFRGNEPGESGKQAFENSGENFSDTETEYVDSDYDDGFDELLDPETEDEEDGEMDPEQVRSRFRFAMGAGNLVSVIVGTAAFLILLTLLLSMINFLKTDLSRNLTLFQTKF